ncbi:hypothetical protein KIW84_075637 [Lathyrus oleraceus]|uniref:Uncharacterized protein n=1 Tax=Pisum sativum TaxID=3888 RepID=A0A9D4VWZ3_PEA|nr:hypothetical protein KIW84_075637 [Pisum sativum]
MNRVILENQNLKEERKGKAQELEDSNKRARLLEDQKDDLDHILLGSISVIRTRKEELKKAEYRICELGRLLDKSLMDKKEIKSDFEAQIRDLREALKKCEEKSSREILQKEEAERNCHHLRYQLEEATRRFAVLESQEAITQLQALIRGHLVRRQAVSALYCVERIVKVQALARGYNVRRADIGLEVLEIRKDTQCSKSVGSVTSTEAEKLPDNVFVHKLLAASSHAFPLSIRSDFGEPHLAENWLDRWTSSQTVEKGQVKRNTRKSPTVKANDGSTSGSNKQKQGLKKDSKHSLVSAQKPNTWIGGTRLRVCNWHGLLPSTYAPAKPSARP